MDRLVAVALLCTVAAQAAAWELDERPATSGEWGYRPTSAASTNPPAFTWRPQEGAAAYRLQVGRDAEFRDVLYEADSQWSSHCPPRTFPPGQLHWRYRAVRSDGDVSEWSSVRGFTISSDAIAYPQPTLAELKARLPEQHPRLLMRPEEVTHLRHLAENDLRRQWESILRTADKLVAAPPDASDPPKYPPGTKRKSDQWRKIWWGNRVRSVAVADGAATLAFAYLISGDEQYGKAARALLLALTEWDTEGSTNFSYNDEAAMPILYMASRAYDWVYPLLSEEDRARVIAMQRTRGQQCFDHLVRREHLWKPYGSHQNRAWHKLAALATAFVGDIPEADEWLDYAMTVYFTCYPVWNDRDGGWHEGVAYWNSYISRFTQWALAMERAYGIDAFERPYFHRAGYFPMYVMPPGTEHGGFGDLAPRMSSSSVARLVNVLASGAGNSHWKWYAEQHDAEYPGNYLGFLAGARAHTLGAEPPTDLPTSVLFEGTGVAALNTDITSAANNVQILFKSSPMGTISHGHNGPNTFQLNVGGKPLLQNTGRRDLHGSPHHTKWMWRAPSQNVILVDGEGFTSDRTKAVGRVSHFRTSDAIDVVAGEAGDAYPALDRWARRIVFLKPNLFVIHDVIEAKEDATIELLLHAPGEFDLTVPDAGAFEAEHGRVDFEFLHPPQLTISQTDEYDPPPAEWSNFELGEWHLTAATKHKHKRQQFLTLFRVNGQGVDVDRRTIDNELVLALRAGERSYQLRFAEGEFEVADGTIDWHFAD